jgi:hypothetical protein
VKSQEVEARTSKMATANKLTPLQKIKQEKGVLFWSPAIIITERTM